MTRPQVQHTCRCLPRRSRLALLVSLLVALNVIAILYLRGSLQVLLPTDRTNVERSLKNKSHEPLVSASRIPPTERVCHPSLFPNTTTPTTESEADCGDVPFTAEDDELERFKPVLTGPDLCRLLNTVDAFAAALSKANIAFFMYGGTLIGSFRHHGFVPWDDDVDFAIAMDRRQEAEKLLKELKPRFILDTTQKKRWKMYEACSQRIAGVSWKYPFLDINFYSENSTHIWDHDTVNYPNYVYPKDWVFPLISRPFNSRWLPAPQRTKRTLLLTYRLDLCETGSYDHRTERRNAEKDKKTLPCEHLYGVLPFVRREVLIGGCKETLAQGDRVLGQYIFVNTAC